MIPKIIHYCWFSEDKKPKSIQKCIDSWQRHMPDYHIKCWDCNSFDFDSLDFTREAFRVKQYPAVADYVRLFALYSEGGIYLDSDVLVNQSFDGFLQHDFFSGTEAYKVGNDIHFRMEAAIMGSVSQHPFVRQCMSYYEMRHFINSDGTYDNKTTVMPMVMSQNAQELGYKYENHYQLLDEGIIVYPTSFFTNTLCFDQSHIQNIYAIHQNAGSWIDYSNRGWLFRFCRSHDMMEFYHKIERLIAR